MIRKGSGDKGWKYKDGESDIPCDLFTFAIDVGPHNGKVDWRGSLEGNREDCQEGEGME